MAGLRTLMLLLCLASVMFSVDSMTLTQSLRSILSHFTKTRNVAVNSAEKHNARDYIMKTFKDHGLNTWTEEFQSNNAQYPGVNIIGQLPGRYTGSRDDEIVLIGAHYDSEDTTPGVNDNGSGMTALLQALELYTNPDKLNCTRDYTLLFVALDLEELQPTCPAKVNCSCASGLCGSGYFAQNFSSYLNSSGANFQGAFILDTILNHNTTPNSQKLPANIQSVFPLLYQQISNNSFRGDFLAVIGRLLNDNELMDRITDTFKSDGTFKSLAVKIPGVEGRPANWSQQSRTFFQDVFRSDHYRFWDADPSLPAVFLTDTAMFRGYMKQCYHQSCDDINHVTPGMMTFLARTTESVVAVASNITNEKCEMKQADCIRETIIISDEGEITTPYFGTQYPNNIDCGWIIRLKSIWRGRMNFKFTVFDLEDSTNCSADYVEIRDGTDKNATLIGRYCGKTLPPIEAHFNPYLHVTFHSDELGAFKGFKAEFSGAKGCLGGLWQLIGVLAMASLFICL